MHFYDNMTSNIFVKGITNDLKKIKFRHKMTHKDLIYSVTRI